MPGRILVVFAILVMLVGQGLAAQAQPAATKPLWPHLASDIAPDPAVTFGVLPNGMRYALLPNSLPPGAVSIRFAIAFGSLYESDDEQGLAHFIEHMAFNGSTSVPEGEMVKMLERLGLAFGADTNASTGQFDTTYMLDLPKASDDLMDAALFLMRETAGELLFSPDAIERERGVVLAEYRRGDTFTRRRSQQQLDFLIPGSFAAARLPIGQAGVIETAGRETFVSLYHRYYRPERAVLVIVGDFDVATVEQKISDRFSDWRGQGDPGDEPDLSYAPEDRRAEASVFVHPDGGDSISVYMLSPYEERPDTAAERRSNNIMSFASGALSRRLSVLANAPEAPFRRATFGYGDVLRAVNAASGSASVMPGGWRGGLMALEREWRRAIRHGFTQNEVDQQIAAMRTSQVNAAQRELTRTTGQLASQLLSSILDDAVFTLPSSGLARFEAWVGDVTPEVVHQVFAERMAMGAPLFFLASTVDEPGVAEDIPRVWAESGAEAVAPPASVAVAPFAYTDFGAPGVVVSDTRLDSVGARLLVFANGVRLNLRPTDFQRNVVQVSVRAGGGLLALEDGPFGLGSLMRAYGDGGLEKHSSDELRAILSGRAVQTGLSASASAFGGSYSTTPADLELQLQVAAAFLTAPGYRGAAERRWRENIMLSWPRLDSDAQNVLANRGLRALASEDKRFGSHADDGVVDRTFAELRAHLQPLLQTAPIEIAIVGDIDEAAAIAAVAKTFGALPSRPWEVLPRVSARPAQFREDRTPLVLTHTGEASQAMVSLYWPVNIDPDADPQAARILSVLAAVMRLKIVETVREKLGASYSPFASASVSSVYPGWGYVAAGSEVRPEDAEIVADAITAIAREMRYGQITDDEFQRAVTPSLEQLPRNATSNGYWLALVAQAQSRPDLTDRSRLEVVEEGLRVITPVDLVMAANQWLGDEAALRVTILPAAKPADAPLE